MVGRVYICKAWSCFVSGASGARVLAEHVWVCIIIHKRCCFPGLGWTYPCDLWSVGCILVELCSVCNIRRIIIWCPLLWFPLLRYLTRNALLSAHLFGSSYLSPGGWAWDSGRCVVSNSWEFGASCYDGARPRPYTSTYDQESRVSSICWTRKS